MGAQTSGQARTYKKATPRRCLLVTCDTTVERDDSVAREIRGCASSGVRSLRADWRERVFVGGHELEAGDLLAQHAAVDDQVLAGGVGAGG